MLTIRQLERVIKGPAGLLIFVGGDIFLLLTIALSV